MKIFLADLLAEVLQARGLAAGLKLVLVARQATQLRCAFQGLLDVLLWLSGRLFIRIHCFEGFHLLCSFGSWHFEGAFVLFRRDEVGWRQRLTVSISLYISIILDLDAWRRPIPR